MIKAILVILMLTLAPVAASAQRVATVHNIKPTPHSAPKGASLAVIGGAIEFAAREAGWFIEESKPGVIRASRFELEQSAGIGSQLVLG